MEIINTITNLSLRHRGMAIGLSPDQRVELKQALTNIGGAELAGPPPPVPSKHTGPVVLLDGSMVEVTDAEVLGIFGGTTIVTAEAA